MSSLEWFIAGLALGTIITGLLWWRSLDRLEREARGELAEVIQLHTEEEESS